MVPVVFRVQDLDGVAPLPDPFGVFETGLDRMGQHAHRSDARQGVEDGLVAREVDPDVVDAEEIDDEAIHLDAGDEEKTSRPNGAGSRLTMRSMSVWVELFDVFRHAYESRTRASWKNSRNCG